MTEHSVNFLHLTATAWVASYGSTNNHDSLRVMPSYQSRTGSGESIYQIRGQEDCSPALVWAGTERTSQKDMDFIVDDRTVLSLPAARWECTTVPY